MTWIGTTARMAPERELALVEAARTKPAAFGELYDHYQPLVYAFIARRVEAREVAEELATVVLSRACGAVRSGGLGDRSFGGFVYRVAAGAVDDHVRRQGRPIPAGVRASDFDREGDAERAAAIADEAALRSFAVAVDRDALRRAVADLEGSARRVLLLRYFDGLSVDEVGELLGWSGPAVNVALHRALREMRGDPEAEAEATGAA